MILERLKPGQHDNIEKLVVTDRFKLARVNGVWFGLDWRSCDPSILNNERLRDEWSLAQDLPRKTGHNYWRRKQRENAKRNHEEDVQQAIALLAFDGYKVTPP